MVPTIKMNFQSDKVYASNLWICEGCSRYTSNKIGNRDSQNQVLTCDAYVNLRNENDKDLRKDSDLVEYFKEFARILTLISVMQGSILNAISFHRKTRDKT